EPVLPSAHESLRGALALVAGRPLSGHTRGVRSVVTSVDGHWLVTADDHAVQLWDVGARDPAARAVHVFRVEAAISALAMSSSGHWLAAGCDDRSVRLWDLRSEDPAGKSLVLRGPKEIIQNVAIDPKGRWVAAAGLRRTTVLWDLSAKDPTSPTHFLQGERDRSLTALAQILSLAF